MGTVLERLKRLDGLAKLASLFFGMTIFGLPSRNSCSASSLVATAADIFLEKQVALGDRKSFSVPDWGDRIDCFPGTISGNDQVGALLATEESRERPRFSLSD